MRYNQLGNSGLTVSRMALGSMTFGRYSFASFHATVDQAGADEMVGLALDAGVNLFDTAEGYGDGQSEEVLGAALRHAKARDRAVIATKVSTYDARPDDPDSARNSYRHIVGNAEAALRRLRTDRIDLYQLHAPDFTTPWEETLRALDDLVARGLVRYVGWSNHPAWHAALGAGIQQRRGYAPFISAQIHYSPIGRDAEHEILPYCEAAGIGTLIWSPLAGGFLTGKYTRADPAGGGGRRAAFSVPPVDLDTGYRAVDAMADIAERHAVPIAHVAYAWLLAKPQVSSVIIGVSRPEQLADNLAAADLVLADQDVARLDALDPPRPVYPDPRWLTGSAPNRWGAPPRVVRCAVSRASRAGRCGFWDARRRHDAGPWWCAVASRRTRRRSLAADPAGGRYMDRCRRPPRHAATGRPAGGPARPELLVACRCGIDPVRRLPPRSESCADGPIRTGCHGRLAAPLPRREAAAADLGTPCAW